MSGRAVRPWQNQLSALAEWPRTAESAVTREVEQGSSAADLEIPSQTAWTESHCMINFTAEDILTINYTLILLFLFPTSSVFQVRPDPAISFPFGDNYSTIFLQTGHLFFG